MHKVLYVPGGCLGFLPSTVWYRFDVRFECQIFHFLGVGKNEIQSLGWRPIHFPPWNGERTFRLASFLYVLMKPVYISNQKLLAASNDAVKASHKQQKTSKTPKKQPELVTSWQIWMLLWVGPFKFRWQKERNQQKRADPKCSGSRVGLFVNVVPLRICTLSPKQTGTLEIFRKGWKFIRWSKYHLRCKYINNH